MERTHGTLYLSAKGIGANHYAQRRSTIGLAADSINVGCKLGNKRRVCHRASLIFTKELCRFLDQCDAV